MGAAKDLSKQKFHMLTAISPTRERSSNGGIIWLCQCNCGEQTHVRADSLLDGNTKSCGCLNQRHLVGKKFGRLTVTRETDQRQGTMIIWECQCECGETCFVATNNLTSERQISCGCYRQERSIKHGLCGTKAYESWHNRRYRKKVREAITEDFAPMDIQERMDDLGGNCIFCGGKFEHVDHFVPLSRGGAHSLRNLVPSCANCNKTKSSKLVGSEWLPERWDELQLEVVEHQIGETVNGL